MSLLVLSVDEGCILRLITLCEVGKLDKHGFGVIIEPGILAELDLFRLDGFALVLAPLLLLLFELRLNAALDVIDMLLVAENKAKEANNREHIVPLGRDRHYHFPRSVSSLVVKRLNLRKIDPIVFE